MSRSVSRPDHALIQSCLKGESAAWEALLERYQRLIYSIPFTFRLKSEDADEIFQRVALKLFEGLEHLRRVEGLAAWISTTTRRECIAWVRSERRLPIADNVDEDPAVEPPDIMERLNQVGCEHALRLAFLNLDPTCLELLSLLFVADPRPPYAQISEKIGRPVGSLGPIRARCLDKLRRLYLKEGGEIPD